MNETSLGFLFHHGEPRSAQGHLDWLWPDIQLVTYCNLEERSYGLHRAGYG